MWIAIAMALVGLVLVAKVWEGFSFDLLGAAGALFSAFALTAYFLIGKNVTDTRSPISATVIGLGVASIFWSIVLPLWQFPTEIFSLKMDIHGYLAGHLIPGCVS